MCLCVHGVPVIKWKKAEGSKLSTPRGVRMIAENPAAPTAFGGQGDMCRWRGLRFALQKARDSIGPSLVLPPASNSSQSSDGGLQYVELYDYVDHEIIETYGDTGGIVGPMADEVLEAVHLPRCHCWRCRP